MKIKIGSLEVSDVTLEELDQLVRRYGLGPQEVVGGGDWHVVGAVARGGGGGASASAQPPLLDTGADHKGRTFVGGLWRTPAEIIEYRRQLASPSPLPGMEG